MNSGKKHITILCSRLDLPGSVERAVVNTANLFAEKGHNVVIVILDTTDACFYPVLPSVFIVQQALSFGISKEGNLLTRKIRLLSDVLKLRKLLKELRPDFIIATEYPFAASAILAGAGRRSKVVSWEHHHLFELKRNLFWHKIFKYTYPRLDAVVCLNEDEKKLFEFISPNSTVIPNFIEQNYPAPLINKRILTIGRLTHSNGTDLLLQTAKMVLQQHPDWQWKLIGDGDMIKEVSSFIKKEKLQNRLILQKPVHHNVFPEYQDASMYVMTSRHKCSPMTLLEAQSIGLPCVAFNCETGPRHIINHNENGMLAERENPAKLADAISSLINGEEKRKQMGEKALENIQHYSAEKVYQLWEKVF